MDTLSKIQRSDRMRLIRGTGTHPELLVESLVKALGYSFHRHYRDLPGTPDITFVHRRKVLFIHGCFWHRHNRCSLARLPKSRLDFWLPKLMATKKRDAVKRRALTKLGWRSEIIWECELRDPIKVMFKILNFLEI